MRFKKSNCRKKMVFSQPDVSRLENCGENPTPSQHKYNQNFKLNNCAISKIPETSHIFKPLCVPCICRTHPESFSNSSKIQISVYEPSFRGVIFPEGASPLRADWKPESLASCKVVYREVYTEGSRTAKVCTDEQKVHKRHNNEDEYPQQYEVQNSVLNMLLNQIIVM